VTPLSIGTNLVQVRHGNEYIIARIQVHDEIKGWWFGNSSITTAKDAVFAHSQPSLYALFSDDPSGTDLVGDITGHKYVTLSSSDDSIFTVDANGRLQGFQEQEGDAVGDAKLNGAFLTQSHTLNVKVFDYAKPRKKLTTGRIKIYLGPKRKLRYFINLQPCCLVDEVNHTRIHHLHQWSGIQSNTQYEDSQWNQRSQFPIR